jgi:hypothetical protein
MLPMTMVYAVVGVGFGGGGDAAAVAAVVEHSQRLLSQREIWTVVLAGVLEIVGVQMACVFVAAERERHYSPPWALH